MKITAIGCLHGYFPELPVGDLLIVTGDVTASDNEKGWLDFETWIINQKYKEKIIIAGNHDNFLNSLDEHRMWKYWDKVGVIYLCDSGTEFEGLKIWGSPWSLTFPGINPHCTAFTGTEKELEKHFDKIPDDVDILITHSPPFGILDGIPLKDGSLFHAGSKELALKVGNMENPPKLWVFSHIHEAYGIDLPVRCKPCKIINCSIMNERYKPVNKPIEIEL